MKRLIVCCDGTWNRPDHVDQGVAAPTNVAKLALALADHDEHGTRQVLYYQAGVGTRRWEHLLGGGFGVGLSRNVKDCYRFLVDNYERGAELFRRSYAYPEVYVDFVGVWDTVGALGIPIDGFRPPGLSNLWTFHDTRLSRYVRHAYHAVAIDERREPFRPT